MPVLTDKDKRSSKLQRTALVNDLHTENGTLRPEAKAVTIVERPALDSGRKKTDSKPPLNDGRPLDNSAKCQPSGGAKANLYNSNKELPNGKVDSNLPSPIVLSRPPSGTSRQPADEKVAVPPRIPVTHHIDGSSKKKHSSVGAEKQLPREDWVDKVLSEIRAGIPQQDTSSAAMDDSQEWLFRSEGLHSKPKAKVEDSGAAKQEQPLLVGAEAVHLPAIDMFALPYLVPF